MSKLINLNFILKDKIINYLYNPSARNTVYAYMVMIFGKFAGFALTLILARLMNLDDYGGFVYARNLIFLLAPICTFGFSNSVLKFIPNYFNIGNFELIKGFTRFSLFFVFITSVLVSLCVGILIIFVPHLFLIGYETETLWALLGISILALLTLLDPIARSYGFILKAYIPSQLGLPVSTLLLVSIIYFFSGNITTLLAVKAFTLALFLMMLIQILFIEVFAPKKLIEASCRYKSKEWVSFSLPLTFVSLAVIVSDRGPLLIAGASLQSSDIGIYGILLAFVQIVQMAVFAVSGVMSPKLSGLISVHQYHDAIQLLSRMRKISVLGVILMGVLLSCFAYTILPFLLPNFSMPWSLFLLMMVVPFITGIFGPTNTIAIALNKRSTVVYTSIFSAIIVIFSSLILIPFLGLFGITFASILGEISRLGIIALLLRGHEFGTH
jgi:O-antigen/teichoic acid export membrane protein